MRLFRLGTYLFLCLSSLAGLYALYTNEPAVKLLTVGFFAIRYEAQESEYRESVTDGEDLPADIDPIDEANRMPNKTLVLMPGGCAKYNLPAKKEDGKDELYIMVKPGKKLDSHGHYNYKDKADITLTATTEQEQKEQKECSVSDTDRSGEPSDYCMLNISTIVSHNEITLGVEVCVPQSEVRDASLWELWISPEHDSRRAKGTFEEAGRDLFRKTEPFKTWLTMTSIVGKAGVGKSTVASFLAGNMSMFTTGSSSDGTTTVGTDISPIIPISEYISVLDEKLREGNIPFVPEFDKPENRDRPLFFMDSEGMSFRGDDFDFITSGPAAIVAKSIVYIIVDRFHVQDVLDDIGEYLDGLDKISMGDNSDQQDIYYGDFVIVLNKMQNEDTSDEEMLDDLLGYSGDDDRSETLDKLEEKFESLSVIGLPMVHVEEGEKFGYPVLPERFREGLTKLANIALRGSESPRNVVVGDELYEMNSTKAIPVMSMLVEASNSGNMDLSDPCNVLYSYYLEKVNEMMFNTDTDIETQLSSSCSEKSSDIVCTDCVCNYRTKLVDTKKETMIDTIKIGKDMAKNICKDELLAERISNLESEVNEWSEGNKCKGPMISYQLSFNQESTIDTCDISQMKFEADTSIDITCKYLFLCGTKTIGNSELNIITNKTFIDSNTKILIAAPPSAQDTLDGLAGKNLTIRSSGLLPGSVTLSVELYGGDGRDGANGANGADGGDGKNGINGKDGRDGKDGINGVDGRNGKNGRPGDQGKKGEDGKDGNINSGTWNVGCSTLRSHEYGEYYECSGCCWSGCTSKHCGAFTCHGCCRARNAQYDLTSSGTCNNINGNDGRNGGNGGNGEDGSDGSDGTNGGDGEDGEDGSNGEDGMDGRKGGNGGNGVKGGNGGEAGHCIITEDVGYECHRFGGKAGRGGTGGMAGKGGKGGKGGQGGLGGTGGKGGLGSKGGKGGKGGIGKSAGKGGRGGMAGYGIRETRHYTARIHYKETPTCISGGGWCSSHYPMEYETCDRLGYDTLNIERICEGRAGKDGKDGIEGHNGQDGMDGNDGKPGKHGNYGKPGHDGNNGIDGSDGEPGQRGSDGKPGESTKSISKWRMTEDSRLHNGSRVNNTLDSSFPGVEY